MIWEDKLNTRLARDFPHYNVFESGGRAGLCLKVVIVHETSHRADMKFNDIWIEIIKFLINHSKICYKIKKNIYIHCIEFKITKQNV